MAKVSLRTYNREIETLIDRAHIEEAADHCKHILQVYPKHLETYRLLGKAFLECQRFGESADIFERVLASIPDDFFSHVGMSIIREDENNLDRAIWHMERAFESQPANTVVQNELRRLFTRRDGVEPPRIRLTRGALARMYARGDLYQQAIAELRAALAEDPNRVDLRVMLARMCFLSGQRVEATQICGDLLSKYPYNYEANRILAEILPATSRAEDAKVYRQRMYALDPYAAFTTPDAPLPTEVADNAIMVEQLEWSASAASQETGQPHWAASLGVSISSPSAPAKIPDWIQASDSAEGATSTAQPAPALSGAAGPAGEPGIPDWMKDAGWAPAAPGSEEQPGPGFSDADEPAADGLAPAEIPAWLKAMAPANIEEDDAATRDKAFEDLFGAVTPAASVSQPAPKPAAPGQDSLPAWLKDMDTTEPAELPTAETPAALPGATFAAAQPAQGADDSLDWLNEIQPAEETRAESSLPDWLSTLESPAAPAAEETAAPAGQTLPGFMAPGWLKEFSESAAPAETPAPGAGTSFAEELAPAELPDWLAGLEPPAAETPPVLTAPGASASPEQPVPADLPDWFSELAAPAAVNPPAQEPAPAADFPSAELPDWLAGLEPASAEIPANAVTSAALSAALDPAPGVEQPALAEPAQADLPDWFSELAAPSAVAPGPEEPAPAEELAPAELPDWLSALQPPAEQPQATAQPAAQPEVEQPAEELPAWLSEIETPQLPSEPTPAGLAEPVTMPPAEAVRPTVLMPAEMPLSQSEEDAALAWLEGLAAKQGADEQVLFVKPEDRSAQPPAWVQAGMDQASAEEPVASEMIAPADAQAVLESPVMLQPSAAADEFTGELPDWLQEIEAPALDAGTAAALAAVEPQIEDLPPTLVPEALASVPVSVAPISVEDTPEPGELITEEIPDWLLEIETPGPKAVEAAGQPIPVAETPADSALSQSEEDAALAWLEGLAAKQGADEQVLFVRPEDRAVEPPAWVQAGMTQPAEEPGMAEVPAPSEELPAAAQAASEPEALPDWLAALETPAADQPPVEEPTAAQAVEVESPAAAEIPDWLSEINAPAAVSSEPAEMPLSQTEEDEALAWLEGLAAKQGADEQVLFVRPEDRTAEPPAWVQAGMAEPVSLEAAGEGSPADVELPAAVDQIVSVEPETAAALTPEALPDWLAEIETPDLAAPQAGEQSLAQPEITMPEPVVSTPAGSVTEEIPAWLEEIETPTEEIPVSAVPTALGTPQEVPLSQSEEDAALAWLEGLAAKQGADEQVLFVKPEERTAEPPAWVTAQTSAAQQMPEVLSSADTALQGQEEETPAAEIFPVSETSMAPEPAGEVPDWLAEIETPTADSVTATSEAPLRMEETEAGVADWLQEIAAETAVRAPAQTAGPTAPSAEEVPTWLVEMEAAEAPTQVTSRAEFNRAIADITARNAAQTDQQAAAPVPEVPAAAVPAIAAPATAVPALEPASSAPVPVQTAPSAAGPDAVLSNAQSALAEGQVEQAVSAYLELVSTGSLVDEVVHDLREALYHYPVDISIWQALGDALLRVNRIQEALDAYTKAEDLLR